MKHVRQAGFMPSPLPVTTAGRNTPCISDNRREENFAVILEDVASLIGEGKIIAVKGIGRLSPHV